MNFLEILTFEKENYFKLNLDYFRHHTDENFKYSFMDGVPKFNNLYSENL